MAKRIIALLLAVSIAAFALTACSKSPEGESSTTPAVIEKEAVIPEDATTFKLSYTQSDSLDPLKCTTLNNQVLSQLVFEPLFKLDENFKASLNIASSYEYTDSEMLKVGITLGIKYSNGSALTADDVVSSFNAAKESAFWGNSLAGISSCSKSSDSEIVFHLAYPNSYAHNLLVFPIESRKPDGDYPVGSGRYYFANENGETVLKANTASDFAPHLTVIHLENIAAQDSVDNAVNIGNISFAFRDLSVNTSQKITANKKLLNMNNLVYLGVNNKSGVTANADIRKAISLAVSRNTLVKSAYGGFAQSATGVFNPQFELSQTKLFDEKADADAATQALAKSGVNSPSLSILVNSSNSERLSCAKLIKQELEAVGFYVSLYEEPDNEKYRQYVESESFNLYIGETKLSPDMCLNSFFAADGATHYGIDIENGGCAAAYGNYMSGNDKLGTFLLAFSDEMPYIPLLYRKGMVCFTKAMNGDVQSSYYDCFANIENWYFNSEQ